MLTENDIIDITCDYLSKTGYIVNKKCNTQQKGIDIEATYNNGKKYYIEAKGATSSKSKSKRYGKPFTSSQITIHLAEAVYATLKNMAATNRDNSHYAIALPKTNMHVTGIQKIKSITDMLNIDILLVSENEIVKM